MLFIKIKFFMLLMMVLVGLFSRFVFGFPLILPTSLHVFHRIPHNYHFPEGGVRTSLRFISIFCFAQKRRRKLKKEGILEEELTMSLSKYNLSQFDFIGEPVEKESDLLPISLR